MLYCFCDTVKCYSVVRLFCFVLFVCYLVWSSVLLQKDISPSIGMYLLCNFGYPIISCLVSLRFCQNTRWRRASCYLYEPSALSAHPLLHGCSWFASATLQFKYAELSAPCFHITFTLQKFQATVNNEFSLDVFIGRRLWVWHTAPALSI